jgi:Flp pilus assembly protein TadD
MKTHLGILTAALAATPAFGAPHGGAPAHHPAPAAHHAAPAFHAPAHGGAMPHFSAPHSSGLIAPRPVQAPLMNPHAHNLIGNQSARGMQPIQQGGRGMQSVQQSARVMHPTGGNMSRHVANARGVAAPGGWGIGTGGYGFNRPLGYSYGYVGRPFITSGIGLGLIGGAYGGYGYPLGGAYGGYGYPLTDGGYGWDDYGYGPQPPASADPGALYGQQLAPYGQQPAPPIANLPPDGAAPVPPQPLPQPPAPNADPQAAQNDSDAARIAFRNGDYAKAQELAEKALKATPEDANLLQFMGLIQFARGNYGEAAAAAYAVLSQGPGWDWKTLIGFYAAPDTYTRQLRALEEAQRKTPDAGELHFLLAYHYLALGSKDGAIRQLRQAIKLTPDDKLSPKILDSLLKDNPAVPAPPVPQEK